MYQNRFIIGATGKVGKTLISQIFEKHDYDFAIHENPMRIMGLASSEYYLFSKHGLSKKECEVFLENPKKYVKYTKLDEIYHLIKDDSTIKNMVFVDTTASKEIVNFHLKVIGDSEFGIVTANKNPITLESYEVFRKLTRNPWRYGYRCSAMAGADSITFLQDSVDINDPAKIIEGCFSGTLGFICTELENGKKFSEIIKDAYEKGYTEPHPRDDLSGLDVARKILVLARTSGYAFNLNDIKVTPFIPEEYFKEDNALKFLKNMESLDNYFEKKMKNASENNKTLRYVAKMDATDKNNKILTVSLMEVEKNSDLGRLIGTSNKIVIVTESYPKEKPYTIQSSGAGLEVTARNIRRDLLYQIKDRKVV